MIVTGCDEDVGYRDFKFPLNLISDFTGITKFHQISSNDSSTVDTIVYYQGAHIDRVMNAFKGSSPKFGDVTAFFLIGAAGDQAPSIRAQFRYVGKDGQIQIEDIHEQGFMIAEMLGKRLGAEVLRVAETLKCQDRGNSIVIQHYIVKCPGQKIADMKSIHPTKEYEFILAEDRNEPVVIIRLDDIAMVGVRPELSCVTAESIRDQSPFPHTMIMTLVNGGAKYMPDESAYDRITYEAMNSFFARGSAELLCEKVLGFLRKRI